MTDHPSALVSVPVEPTQEMVDRAQEFWPDIRDMWAAMLAAAPAAPQAAGVGEEELIERGLRTIRAYDAVRYLRDALSATTARLTGYDWNADPEGLTKRQGDAFAAADKVFADLDAAVAAHPEIELPECQTCGGAGKIEETARTEGANQHSACVRTCDDCDGCGFAPDDEPEHLRAPSREPEGGAVDDGAFKIATDLHKAYEQLIYGLPKYLDAENLTDEENMIREAWVTLDVTAHRLAALVTREEAPTSHVSDRYKFDDEIAWLREAARYFSARDTQGEDRAHWANVYNAENARKLADRLAELSSNPCQLEAPAEAGEVECDGCDGDRCVYVGSLCNPSALPQAREDAQPVGWLRAADEEMVCAHLGVADAEDSYETAKKKLASLIQWNIAVATDPRVGGHPAPDALRVAVEASGFLLDRLKDLEQDVNERDFYGHVHPAAARLRLAIAALQAEQGAK